MVITFVCFLINGTHLNKLIKQVNDELQPRCTSCKSSKLPLNTIIKNLLHVFSQSEAKIF